MAWALESSVKLEKILQSMCSFMDPALAKPVLKAHKAKQKGAMLIAKWVIVLIS